MERFAQLLLASDAPIADVAEQVGINNLKNLSRQFKALKKVALEAGYHELHLLYFEDYMGQELEVGYSGRNVLETVLPDTMLFVPD